MQTDLFTWRSNLPKTESMLRRDILAARTSNNHNVLRGLWQRGPARVRNELTKRGYHPGTCTFLPNPSVAKIWDEVKAVQKRCRAGVLTRKDVEWFHKEWGDIRDWLRLYPDVDLYNIRIVGREVPRPHTGKKSTMVSINVAGSVLVRRASAFLNDKEVRGVITATVIHDKSVPAPDFYTTEPYGRDTTGNTVQSTVRYTVPPPHRGTT